jgi:hypothetical protein
MWWWFRKLDDIDARLYILEKRVDDLNISVARILEAIKSRGKV